MDYARDPRNPNRYCFDLNDEVFTPGDTVRYVFGAVSGGNPPITNYYSRWLNGQGEAFVTADSTVALNSPLEFTALPTGKAHILYVDDAGEGCCTISGAR